MILPGFIAATGLCWILMYGEPTDWIRGFAFKTAFGRKLLTCAMCCGLWVGMLFWVDPSFRLWWFPFGVSAIAWLFTQIIAFASGVDPKAPTVEDGTNTRFKILESNSSYVRFRYTDPERFRDGVQTLTLLQFTALMRAVPT